MVSLLACPVIFSSSRGCLSDHIHTQALHDRKELTGSTSLGRAAEETQVSLPVLNMFVCVHCSSDDEDITQQATKEAAMVRAAESNSQP